MAAQTAAPEEIPTQHALLVADEAAGGKGVVIFDGDDLIVDLCVEHIGDEACADALDLVGALRCPCSAQERRQALQPPP